MILDVFWGFGCSEYLSFFGGSIVTTHTGGSVIWVTSWQGPDEQLGGEKKVGDWDNPPLFAVKKVAVAVLSIVVLVIVYSIYSQLQLYISYVCVYIYIYTLYICLYLGQYMVMVLSPVVVLGILAALAAAQARPLVVTKLQEKAFDPAQAVWKSCKSEAQLQPAVVPPFKAQRNFDF